MAPSKKDFSPIGAKRCSGSKNCVRTSKYFVSGIFNRHRACAALQHLHPDVPLDFGRANLLTLGMEEITSSYSKYHPMWDGPGPDRPMPGNGLFFNGDIEPSEIFGLNPNLWIRKELFGCIVTSQPPIGTRFYDAEAFDCIKWFATDRSGSEMLRHFAPPHYQFLLKLLGQGILMAKRESQQQLTSARIFDFTQGDSSQEFSTPAYLAMEITRRCRRACSYCAYDSGPHVNADTELDTTAWKDLLRQASELGVYFVEFTGGDPLCRTDALEIFDYANALGVSFSINSDLSGLTDEQVRALSSLQGLTSIQITLDGPNEQVNDFLRGNGAFQLTIENTKRLIACGVQVSAGMVVAKHNFNHVEETATLCKQLGLSGFHISALYPSGRGSKLEKNVCSDTELKEASQQYAAKVFSGEVAPHCLGFYNFSDEYAKNPESFNHLSGIVCMADPGVSGFRISPEGMCYTSIKLEGSESFMVGDVRKQGLLDVWRTSVQLRSLRLRFYTQPGNRFGSLNVRSLNDSPFLGRVSSDH